MAAIPARMSGARRTAGRRWRRPIARWRPAIASSPRESQREERGEHSRKSRVFFSSSPDSWWSKSRYRTVRGDRECPGKLGFSFAIFVSRPLPYKIHGGKSCYPRAERQKYGLMRAPRRHAPPRELSGVASQLGGQGAHAGSREPRNKFSRFPARRAPN